MTRRGDLQFGRNRRRWKGLVLLFQKVLEEIAFDTQKKKKTQKQKKRDCVFCERRLLFLLYYEARLWTAETLWGAKKPRKKKRGR